MDVEHFLAMRIARPTRDLTRSVRFYRDVVGLVVTGGFDDHEGHDGVFWPWN